MAIHRVKKNVLMKGGWFAVVFCGIWFVITVIRSVQQRTFDWDLVWLGLILVYLLPRGWWQLSTKQWLLVPGGLILRKARIRKHTWDLHLFDRRRSVLCVNRHDKNIWRLTIADAEACEIADATKREVDLLLKTWLSSLSPPPPERLTDLV